ncbi:MAG: hypothetical protein ALECFALPRED_009917 [Alectoria fallacina]|uniref:ubiquitinyl hydrolase 1 n=1 Tax=Alectoria fallacina TaxID=1903189 RepID=A0A8H3J8A6_9LECA|nr:MAG: hypothetical protein ALECFALPRED_009917 [Alectoria fallacina]
MAERALEFVFNHVFLPPQLPHHDDHQNGAGDRALVEHLIECCHQFRDLNYTEHYAQWSTILSTLRTFATLHRNNTLSKNALISAFRDSREGQIVVLHIAMQNSGLIIRKVAGDYLVESFEASPPAAEVLAAEKSLQWDFPSRAVAVPSSIFEEASFQKCFAEFLEKASVEPVKQFAAVTLKAGSYAFESRDTATPAVVGQLLMALLEATGRKHTAMLTRKRVHDEVCWGDGAENPWRRSPTWLTLRVGIQRSLCFLLGGNLGTLHYKFFMSFVLSSLSKKVCVEGPFPPDRLAFARTKLARRVAKIQQLKDIAAPQAVKIIDFLFSRYGKEFTNSLRTLNDRLSQDWGLVRFRATKRISPLPRRADTYSTVLSLFHSRAILQRILEEALFGRQLTEIHLEERYRKSSHHSTWAKMEPRDYCSVFDYLFLAQSERKVKSDIKKPFRRGKITDLDRYCVESQHMMQQYQRLASLAYKSDPEQLSLMIITLLEMWQAIDSIALILYPLLADYEPELPRDLLYSLQVAQLADLQRVQDIENYIEHRRSVSNPSNPSVFRDVSPESFAVRYFDQSEEMQQLAATIMAADEIAKIQKEEEWVRKSFEYEAIMKQAAETTCLFIEDAFDPLKRQHDDRHCLKHQLERIGARMRIQIHEAILPCDDAHVKSLIFELLLPKAFAAWRDANWQLVQLGRRSTIPDREPQVSLRDYQGLRAYMKPTGSSITLASRTKSFLYTHYAQVSFPTALDQVCLPHGLKYGLFDHSRNLWTSRHLEKPSFADLCAPSLPPKSVYGSLRRYFHPTFDGKPLSANEIIAGQTRCPNSFTMIQFTTFQDLRLGNRIQWFRLLRELASSNLNFGTLEVGILVAEVALVVGPSNEQNLLRTNHWVFQDLSFCVALIAHIKRRLESIAANWREGQTVECLLVLLQRIWSLATSFEARNNAEVLMLYVRKVTHDWTRILRREICNATSTEIAQKRSQDAILATLLCRKTFIVEATKPNEIFQADTLAIFLECSFILKENLPSEVGFIGNMPVLLKKLYVSDLKLVHDLESQLRRAIQLLNHAVNQAVNSVWTDAEGQCAREFSSWSFLSEPHDGWVTAQSTSVVGLLEQTVHFDILDGTLLIDSQPLGRLPDEYTKQVFFHQIFGNRVFRIYPSSIPGMSYQLASLFEGHQIHFGFRDGVPFMRARLPNRTLELVLPSVFLSRAPGDTPDLPLPLINDCVHWLDLATHSIEIRPFTTMWRSKPGNWIINLRTSEAHRRFSLLVDPRSSIFDRIASIIEPFERRSRMIVFQPQRNNISLHLPSLELSFRVNREGLLESQQLRAVIDSDQDAGTLHGIESKLVLRDSIVPEDRSIVVAMGPATIEKNGPHVRIGISHTGFYARFFINKVLGRLECASEPRLIYFKAYCHAVTAFVLPDPLTGRTGTDEAIHCLRSSNAQPWAPVDEVAYGFLSTIADLTPQRIYYPEKLKALQRVLWRDHISSAVQHDEFRPIIRHIMQQCRVLHRFHLGSAKPPADDRGGDDHLLTRARTRRDAFRAWQHEESSPSVRDRNYVARDCARSIGSKNAYESASLIKNWSYRIKINQDLSATLQEWPTIQGFDIKFELHLLADLINVNLAVNWGSLFSLCQRASETQDKFRLMFLFATMSFDSQIDMTVMRTLIAVAIMDDFQNLQLPRHPSFTHFRRGQVPNADFLSQLMKPYRIPYPGDERALLSVAMHGKQKRKLEMAQFKHEQQSEDDCKAFARHLLSQWPVCEPSMRSLRLEDIPLLDAERAYQAIKPEWERLFANYEFSEHLGCVQNILKACQATGSSSVLSVSEGEQQFYSTPVFSNTRPTMQLLLCKLSGSSHTIPQAPLSDYSNATQARLNGPIISDSSASVSKSITPSMISSRTTRNDLMKRQSDGFALINTLYSIIRPFANSEDPVRRAYGRDLHSSTRALENLKSETSKECVQAAATAGLTEVSTSTSLSRIAVQSQFDFIRTALTQEEGWLEAGGLLPYITPVSLLEMFRPSAIPKDMSTARDVIIKYGELIVHLQHTLRIQGATLRKDTFQLANETQLAHQTNWQARDHPDWLLLELDFNVRIRPDQHEVALAMTSPSSNGSFCLQMNMGQGKSSVIIPMVVAQLADTKNLVRVVVPRPLLLQTAQLLQARLGGLVGRKIKHVPFSRRSSTTITDLRAYHNLHLEMLRDGGVILTLPEHMLSFQLSGLQELSNGHIEQATSMIRLQEWLMRNCRDILDECDHMLAVKTQLIYPSGAQTMVDGHPGRWKLVQNLLKLVKEQLGPLRRNFPKSIEVIERSRGTFPTIYLLTPQVKEALMQRLTDSVVKGDGGILPIDGCSLTELASVNSFLRDAQFPKATALKIAGVFKDNSDARQRLLLLRGLLIHKILLLGLGKRWNVQYGIDTRRDPIAVPFKGKGIPSDQAEFGHPDVSIILTCLSFYHSGLSLPQFQQTLTQLIKSDDEPVREFDSWTRDIQSFPDSLRSWSSINVDDETQCAQLWSHLGQQMAVINYFLNHHVFPRHSRVFERKLVSSGWDIATQVSSEGDGSVASLKESRSTSLTVGFSGTNDNRTLLPLNILQDDLPGLAHTNAEVLTYFLQFRNRRYVPASRTDGKRLTERAFLCQLKDNGIRMLLDAGAQILEMDNKSLAQAWLEVDYEAEAAVFFGEDDRARVLYKDGKSQPLAGSPFLNNLGACVVYLDEAHTRGVDLKMPADAIAGLTLGIQQTKDHTVQAAMRLRQLAISQSIVFFAPPEVHQSILNFRGKTSKDFIDSRDVIIWLLEQTCCSIEQLQPLYISQGLEYCRRRLAAQRNPDASSQEDQRKAYLKVLEQPERYSLENLYAPDQKTKSRPVDAKGFPEIAGYVEKLGAMKKGLRNTGDTVQALAHQEVEQEREVQIEVETVREVKKPNHATPIKQPPLHRDVKSFAETGRLVAGSQAYQQAFVALRQTALGRRLGISDSATRSRLFVTQDFSNVVVVQWGKPLDEYSRPVHWILWSTTADTALIISDFEADALLPLIRDRRPTSTHLITYAAPVTRAMVAFDTLKLYSVPSLPANWRAPTWLVRDLGIFAGRLYFDFDDQSRAVYQALGLPPPASTTADLEIELTEMDLWSELPFGDARSETKQEPFSTNPLLFMQEWLAIRRKGQDFSQSMVGELIRGRRLERGDGAEKEDADLGENVLADEGEEDAGVEDE